MRQGVRNLRKRLENDHIGTIETLENEGYLVCEVDERLNGVFCEASGSCITPNTQDLNTPSEWLEKNGVNFKLDYYTLFGFDKDENGDYVDWQSIECFNFQDFADELGDLLARHKCIMQTWKYKSCVIAPAPKEVFYLNEWGIYVAVYKPVLFNFKKLDKVIQEIKDLAYSHLHWEMTNDRKEEAKERLKRIHAIQAMKRREEYEERVWEAEIPQKFFDLVRSAIGAFSNSNVHIKFNKDFMAELNLAVGKLRQWLRSKDEARQEFKDIKESSLKKIFDKSLLLRANDMPLCLGYTPQNEVCETSENESLFSEEELAG